MHTQNQIIRGAVILLHIHHMHIQNQIIRGAVILLHIHHKHTQNQIIRGAVISLHIHIFFYKQLGFQSQPEVANSSCQNEAQSC